MKYVVSFTTSPLRIHKCDKMIRSILFQTRKPDLVLLNIPDVFSRTGKKYNIPKKVRDKVTINKCGRDWGPATKIVPTVRYLLENGYDKDNTRIIYLDDDINYPKSMIECLQTVEDDECVWSAAGFNFLNLQIHGQRIHNNKTTIAEGYCGVCVKLSTFKDDFEEYMNKYMNNQDTKLSDDVILSNYYHKVKVPIKTFKELGKYSLQDLWKDGGILDYGNLDDALHNGADGTSENNVKRYLKVIKILNANNERYFKLYFKLNNDIIEK